MVVAHFTIGGGGMGHFGVIGYSGMCKIELWVKSQFPQFFAGSALLAPPGYVKKSQNEM
jgi:hypothetical protein